MRTKDTPEVTALKIQTATELKPIVQALRRRIEHAYMEKTGSRIPDKKAIIAYILKETPGMSRGQVSAAMYHGQARVTLDTLYLCARAVGLTLRELFQIEEE
jgi:hypothetical protein